MSRRNDLLEAAAEAMDRAEDPFHVSFLSEHKVTLDEAYDLSETLALAARIFLALNKRKHQDTLIALIAEVTCGEELGQFVADAANMQRITKELGRR